MTRQPALKRWRRIRASWRDSMLLLREFRLPILWFIVLLVGVGAIYYYGSLNTSHPVESLLEGMYIALTLIFLQPAAPFPEKIGLQVLFFLMPVAGLAIVAQGLADFGILFFNRRARGKEWEMAVASTFNQHILLIGLGHLGYRVVRRLRELGKEVVVVELSTHSVLTQNVRRMDVPVIEDDATREDILEAAGVRRARTIILCTQNDSLNLEVALKARKLNPEIEVVVRIFEDGFAESLQNQFGFKALSATGIAAPMFAAAAADLDITPPVAIEGIPHILARLVIGPRSGLAGRTVLEAEESYQISLVLHRSDGQRDLHPAASTRLKPGDSVAVFGTPDHINRLILENG